MTGKPKSLRDKLRIVLNVLVEMEGETGTVRKTDLLEKLSSEFDISRGEVERLLVQLTREGTVFEPRNGYYKKI